MSSATGGDSGTHMKWNGEIYHFRLRRDNGTVRVNILGDPGTPDTSFKNGDDPDFKTVADAWNAVTGLDDVVSIVQLKEALDTSI
tara:strand:+ start:1330 stop:1584 length:255 start_codon:yes stop_codon:yes gene_type:complete